MALHRGQEPAARFAARPFSPPPFPLPWNALLPCPEQPHLGALGHYHRGATPARLLPVTVTTGVGGASWHLAHLPGKYKHITHGKALRMFGSGLVFMVADPAICTCQLPFYSPLGDQELGRTMQHVQSFHYCKGLAIWAVG